MINIIIIIELQHAYRDKLDQLPRYPACFELSVPQTLGASCSLSGIHTGCYST